MQASPSEKNFIAGPQQVTFFKKTLSLSSHSIFISFSFFGLLRQLPQISRVWLLQKVRVRSP